jgi:hypothetical protein
LVPAARNDRTGGFCGRAANGDLRLSVGRYALIRASCRQLPRAAHRVGRNNSTVRLDTRSLTGVDREVASRRRVRRAVQASPAPPHVSAARMASCGVSFRRSRQDGREVHIQHRGRAHQATDYPSQAISVGSTAAWSALALAKSPLAGPQAAVRAGDRLSDQSAGALERGWASSQNQTSRCRRPPNDNSACPDLGRKSA